MFKVKAMWWMVLAASVSVTAGPAEAQPFVYVLGQAPNPDIGSAQLSVFNAATNTRIASARLGRTQGVRQEQIAMAPNGAFVYVVNSLDRTISVVSTQTNTVVDTLTDVVIGMNASGVAVSPDSQRLYVSGTESINRQFQGFVTVVDIPSRSMITRIPVGFQFAYGVAASPDGSRVYVVTGTAANAVAVIGTATNSVITTVPLPGAAQGLSVSLSPDGRFAYLPRRPDTSQTPGYVQVIDTTTNTIVATTTVGIGPSHVGVSPNGATVYVASAQSGLAHELSPSTHASLGSTAIPAALAVAFLPDSSRAYVAASENLVVMDAATRTVIAAIPTVVSRIGSLVGASSAIVTTPARSSGVSPGAPRLSGSVAGTTVNLTWTPSATGSAPTSYVLQAGSAAAASNLFNGNVGLSTSLTAAVSPGTYYLRVRAVTDAGLSAPSNEVTLTAGGGGGAPGQPTLTSAVASGGTLTVAWVPGSGASPTSHRLDFFAGTTPVASVTVGAAPSVGLSIPPGIKNTFAVRVTAFNGTTAGPPSALFTFTID